MLHGAGGVGALGNERRAAAFPFLPVRDADRLSLSQGAADGAPRKPAPQRTARSRPDRQWPHRGAGRRARAHRVVVLPALRRRPSVLAPARRRRGEGLLRRSCSTASRSRSRAMCATPRVLQTTLEDPRGRAHHRLRAAVSPPSARSIPRSCIGASSRSKAAAHHRARSADLRLRQALHEPGARVQPYPLHRRHRGRAADHRNRALLHRARDTASC